MSDHFAVIGLNGINKCCQAKNQAYIGYIGTYYVSNCNACAALNGRYCAHQKFRGRCSKGHDGHSYNQRRYAETASQGNTSVNKPIATKKQQNKSSDDLCGNYQYEDKEGRDVFLAESPYALQMAMEKYPDIEFHFTSEF